MRRLPTPRATIYFAVEVKENPSDRRSLTGLFCEGPHAGGFRVTHQCGEMVAVKVRPGSLRALLGVPARELRELTIPLEEVWGRRATSLAEQMDRLRSPDARLNLLQEELLRRCRLESDADPVALSACHVVERVHGKVRVAELIARSGYSQRMFLEKFDDWVGITPKQYARLARLRATIVKLGGCASDPAELALESGYCDQAHMIHDFQDLIGLSPGQFMRTKAAFAPAGAPATGQSALPGRERRLYSMVGLVSHWLGQ